MRDIKVSSRYAKSLLDLAKEQNSVDAVYKDMVDVYQTCQSSKELVLLLKSPIVKSDKKKSILTAVFGDKLSKTGIAFINILITKKRESLLESVAASFIAQYKTLKNIQIAKVVSAIPLTNDLRDKVIALVKDAVKANEIEIEEKVDPEIIGGLIVRVGDKQVDESIKRKILDLEKVFSQNQYIKQY